jgi:hypothetical protein
VTITSARPNHAGVEDDDPTRALGADVAGERGVEPVRRRRCGVVAELPDPERALEPGEARPLGVAQGGEVARGAVRVGHVVAEVARGEDDGVVVGVVGAVVGEGVETPF